MHELPDVGASWQKVGDTHCSARQEGQIARAFRLPNALAPRKQ
jgi:hypothetical protein